MGFKTLTQRIADKSGIDAAQVEAELTAAARATALTDGGAAAKAGPHLAPVCRGPASHGQRDRAAKGALTPIALATARGEAARTAKIDRSRNTRPCERSTGCTSG